MRELDMKHKLIRDVNRYGGYLQQLGIKKQYRWPKNCTVFLLSESLSTNSYRVWSPDR